MGPLKRSDQKFGQMCDGDKNTAVYQGAKQLDGDNNGYMSKQLHPNVETWSKKKCDKCFHPLDCLNLFSSVFRLFGNENHPFFISFVINSTFIFFSTIFV